MYLQVRAVKRELLVKYDQTYCFERSVVISDLG